MRMTLRVLVVALAVSAVLAGCGGKSPREHHERAGGFSYDPPSGWQIVEFPGLKYRISHGPQANDFAPNINVVDEEFAGTLTEYVDVNLRIMERTFPRMRFRGREDLRTHDGQPIVKILTENEQLGLTLRQTYFFIGSASRKYVVTCTALAAGGERFDAAFAEGARSFRIH